MQQGEPVLIVRSGFFGALARFFVFLPLAGAFALVLFLLAAAQFLYFVVGLEQGGVALLVAGFGTAHPALHVPDGGLKFGDGAVASGVDQAQAYLHLGVQPAEVLLALLLALLLLHVGHFLPGFVDAPREFFFGFCAGSRGGGFPLGRSRGFDLQRDAPAVLGPLAHQQADLPRQGFFHLFVVIAARIGSLGFQVADLLFELLHELVILPLRGDFARSFVERVEGFLKLPGRLCRFAGGVGIAHKPRVEGSQGFAYPHDDQPDAGAHDGGFHGYHRGAGDGGHRAPCG